jgi:hypothetical protein
MSSYIAICSLVVSIVAILISFLNNKKTAKTKRHELASSGHEKILSWFNETIETLSLLRHKLESNEGYKKSDLSHLSALIERGRYFFPNIDKKDGNAQGKPPAFRGYRQAILDVLVFSYNILNNHLEKGDGEKYTKHLLILQKTFTSWVLEVLKPEDYGKTLEEQTGIKMATNLTFEDFLAIDIQKYYEEYADFKEIFLLHAESEMLLRHQEKS